MRLTHIKLAGFKSFVDPTTLHVPGQLVAVMGPNGCGKSNVIDAVRWVLGEASAKQLRGESMQDVIFNGATTRKAVSRASVELTFDNSDHRLQGAFGQYAEIAIKRTLTRQGQSTYYINNQVVRRRDITDLFLGTGVGARGYAVIEQGMISRIIEARPEELRAYIEEAAGVSKYKERRKETATRLKETTEHLQRLADIQNELTGQIDKLSIQAQTAEQYQTLSSQLSLAQNQADFARFRQADVNWQEASVAQESLQAQLNEKEEHIQQCAENLYQLQIEEHLTQQSLQNLTEQRGHAREQAARLQAQIEHVNHNQARLQREQSEANEQLQQLHEACAQIQEHMQDTQIQVETAQLTHEEWQLQLESLQDAQPEHNQVLDDLEQAWQHQQDTVHRLEREAALLQQKCQSSQQRLQEWQQRQTALEQEKRSLALPEVASLEAAQERVAVLQEQVLETEALLLQHDEQTLVLQEAVSLAQQEAQTCQQNTIALQAKHQTIAALLPKSNTQDAWENSDAKILWQHLDVNEKWRDAVQILLHERQHTRHLPPLSLPQSGTACAWLTDFDGETTVLPDSLATHIRTSAEFSHAVAIWFGQIRCCDDLGQALAMQHQLSPSEAFVTPQAQWVDSVSVQFLAHSGDALLQHQAQLQTLDAQLAQLQPHYAQAQTRWQDCQQQLSWQQNQTKQTQLQHKQAHEQLRIAHTEATKLLERTQQTQLRAEHIDQEWALLSQNCTQIQSDIQQWQAQWQQLQQAQEELAHNVSDLAAKREQHQTEQKQAQLHILEVQRQLGLSTLALQKAQQQHLHLQQRLNQIEQQRNHWQERQQSLLLQDADEIELAPLQNQLSALSENINHLDTHIQAIQSKQLQLQQERQQIQQQQQQLEAQLPQQRARLQEILLMQQQAQLNKARFAEQLNMREAIWEDLASLPEIDLVQVQADMVGLSKQIQALGAVNLAALEELAQAKERFAYYENQRTDIEQAMALLGDAMAQIDSETKNLFEQTFHAVNQHMQSFFPTLFGGGHAHLQLIGEDMLEAGVTIMAQPPGKKNTTIHLLSGGEKALTAMSLVFALFSLNPAPFCLLDEVDAPLDDANTARFCRLVEKMSQQTQFLYISHNRLTMEMAEQLIGVTMQEKGVSRIVDVDIKQAMALAEQTV